MNARFVLIAAATLMSTSAFAAEPAKPAAQPAAATQQARPAEVVLASADDVHAPSPAAQQAPAQPKRRIARVTTCRCGDPQVEPDQQEQ